VDVDVLYTFEGARTGNQEYASFMNSLFPNAIRITHYDDIVPHLPPKWTGFSHHGTEVYYDEPMESYIVCDGSGEDGKCADQWYFANGINGHTTIFGEDSGCAVSYKSFLESKLKSLEK
jgi:hypothetical protein